MLAALARYRKFIVAAVGAAVLILTAAGQDSFVRDIVAVATALGVYVAPNG